MNYILSLVLIALCCAFSLIELATHRSCGMFCVILIALFVYIIAERDIHIVPDTVNYVDDYILTNERAELSSIFSGTGKFEPGWQLFCLLSRKAGLSYRSFLGLCALIPCLIYLYAMKIFSKYADWGGGHCVRFSLWVCFYGIVFSGIILRIGMSLPFAFLGHILLLTKKHIKALLCFAAAYTFHYSILVYPLFLYLSSLIKMRRKSYYIYGAVIVFLWLVHVDRDTAEIFHNMTSGILNMIASRIEPLSKYSMYIGDLYNSFASRKNFMFLVMMFLFIKARPKNNAKYDHWLKFFAFNLAMTFPMSSFVVGYRVSDICLISALPLCYHSVYSRKFSADLRRVICVVFIVSMFTFSLRMTGVY